MAATGRHEKNRNQAGKKAGFYGLVAANTTLLGRVLVAAVGGDHSGMTYNGKVVTDLAVMQACTLIGLSYTRKEQAPSVTEADDAADSASA